MKIKVDPKYLDFKSFAITNSPMLLFLWALLVDLPPTYSELRLFLIWFSAELVALIMVIRQEIPRLYPYASIKGKPAKIMSRVYLIFWSVFGIIGYISCLYEPTK